MRQATKRRFLPVHPGVLLSQDFLKPKRIAQTRLAKGMGVPLRGISALIQGKRGISLETAVRLGRFFGMEAQFWTNLQSHYDLEVAKDAIGGKL
jgi:addiction module HigA family antidote